MAVVTTATMDGDNRVFTITLSGLQAKMDNLANDASKFYYEIKWKYDNQFKTEINGVLMETSYNDLTNAQKVSVLGLETKQWLLQGAHIYHENTAVNAAKITAENEIKTRY